MPTQARFGRLPRSAPSLTSTIVALAAEYQRVRESNIIDAWKNGGEFEGKPVKDKDVLNWMKARRAELSPDDPKWDYYNNQVVQYEFAIENSKAELDYKRGDKTDQQMAAFYHTWANKLPKDSEAYREREKLAAAYSDRASSGRAASGRAAADRAYAAKITGSYRKEFTYDTQLAFLTNEAMNRGILLENETLYNIDPNTADGRRINDLWNEIATSPEYKDERDFYTAQIKQHGDPSFNGDFSQDAFNGQERVKLAGVNKRIADARAAGREGDIKNFGEDKDRVRGTRLITQGWDETQMYEEARAEWLKTFENPNAMPLEIDRANQKYINELNILKGRLESQKLPNEVDQRLGFVNNELLTMSGDETPLQHWGGGFGPGGNQGGEHATETAIGIKQNQTEIKQLTQRDSNGEPLFVLSKSVGGEAVATNDRNHWAAPWAVVPRSSLPAETIFVIQNDFGDPRGAKVVTAIMPTPIHITSPITNERTGEVVPTTSDTPSAWHYTMPDGTVGYRFIDAGGNVLYTRDNPFVTTNPDGTVNDNPVTLDAKRATVNVPGNGWVMPENSVAINPNYYNPETNKTMTATVAKSGYSLWLMTSDPKNNQAYAKKPEDILSMLSMEAGGDSAKLAAMIVDADQRRAVYLGTSTEEQTRLRQNALNGIQGPVPLSTVMQKAGLGTSAERAVMDSLIKGRSKDQIGEDINRGNLMAGLQNRGEVTPFSGDADSILRKYNMVAPPPKPGPVGPAPAPTSMGSDLPTQIAKGLGDIFGGLFGTAPKPVGQQVPSPLGIRPTAGPAPTAPRATAPPPKPPPVTPPSPSAPAANAPKPYTPTAPTPQSNPGYYQSEKGYAASKPPNISAWKINGPR